MVDESRPSKAKPDGHPHSTRLMVGKRSSFGTKGWPVVRVTYEIVSEHPTSAAASQALDQIERQPFLDTLDAAHERDREPADAST